MKKNPYLIFVFFALAIPHAQAQSYIREHACIVTEADNINTCRIHTLDLAKTTLSKQIGKNIRQQIKVTKDGANNTFASEDVDAITAGLIKASILEEKLDGETYYLKAGLDADTELILNTIKKLKTSKSDGSRKIHETLKANQRTLKVARKESTQLRNQINNIDNKSQKEELITEYIKQVNQISLSNLVDRGYSYHQNGQYNTAALLFQKAAEHGHTIGRSNLDLMSHNCSGIKQDDTQAIQRCRQSAKQGDAEGQLNLGYMYLNGHGVEQDETKAVQWFRRSAEQGYAQAQATLGILYYKGRLVKKDDLIAVYWFRKAAKQGNAQGQSSLGLMYRNGHGVKQDNTQAIHWLNKSAKQGHVTAFNALAWNYATCNFACDGDQAIHWADKLLTTPEILEKEAELDTIAAAYARAGKFKKAIEHQEKAISLLTNEATIADYKSRLELYKNQQPYTDLSLQSAGSEDVASDSNETTTDIELY